MKIILPCLGLFAICALQSTELRAAERDWNSQNGMIRVFVEDGDGIPAQNTAVYISNGKRTELLETDEKGSVQVNLKSGNYTVSSARNVPGSGWIDRYASRPATVNLSAMDSVSVVLRLHPVDDPIPELSLSTLQKMGVAEEVAKYLN